MTKGTSAKDYRQKSNDELVSELKKLREELQSIRFTKVSGTAVAKLSKIKVRNFLICRFSENKSPDCWLSSEKTEKPTSSTDSETEIPLKAAETPLKLFKLPSKTWNSSTFPWIWDPNRPEPSEESWPNLSLNW